MSFKNSGVLVFSWPGISVDALEPSDVWSLGDAGAQAHKQKRQAQRKQACFSEHNGYLPKVVLL